jgi:hypothetical protein
MATVGPRERVTSLRSHHKIPVYRPAENGAEPWLNLTRAAAYLGVSAKTLRLAAESDDIRAMHPLPEGPWLFSRAALDDSAAQALVERARRFAKHPAGPQYLSKIYSLQWHRQMGVVMQDCRASAQGAGLPLARRVQETHRGKDYRKRGRCWASTA